MSKGEAAARSKSFLQRRYEVFGSDRSTAVAMSAKEA